MATGNNDKWAIIKQCIDDAQNQIVEQADISVFLKKTFGAALGVLEELVSTGLDLEDKDVVVRLQDLILAICQIPQKRVRAFNVSDVIADFEGYEERFYELLSLPRQNAETSFSCVWIVDRLDYLAENPGKADAKKLDLYMGICKNLCSSGSDKIRAYLARATENLADIFTSEWMSDEAKKVWQVAILFLSYENVRITQREDRLLNAKRILKLFD
jgi:hypothetical protein